MRYAAFCLQITGWVGSLVLAGCSTQQSKSKFDASYMEKIHIERLDPNNNTGLYGKPNEPVALHYEFCIPGAQKYVEEVQRIDPTISVQKTSSGRIGCTKEQYLCLGSTSQSEHHRTLRQLAEKSYISRIQEAWFE